MLRAIALYIEIGRARVVYLPPDLRQVAQRRFQAAVDYDCHRILAMNGGTISFGYEFQVGQEFLSVSSDFKMVLFSLLREVMW